MLSGGDQNSPFLNLLRIKAAIVMGFCGSHILETTVS